MDGKEPRCQLCQGPTFQDFSIGIYTLCLDRATSITVTCQPFTCHTIAVTVTSQKQKKHLSQSELNPDLQCRGGECLIILLMF